MLYIIGSNLESQYSLATKDMRELLDANLDLNNTTVYICAGGTKNWHSLDLASGEMAIYQLTSTGLKRLTQPRQISMGRPATLTSFLSFCRERTAADKYVLILWDHAGGPIIGYGEDEAHENEGMSLHDLASAIQSGGFGGRKKLEAVIFDVCLMGNLETAAFMSPYAEYMLASEDSAPGNGLDYSKLSSTALTKDDTVTWLEILADRTVNEFYKYHPDSVTLSVYDLSIISEVTAEMNKLFAGSFTKDSLVAISRRVTGVRHVDHDSFVFDLYDLYGFAVSFGLEGRGLQRALSRLIIAHYGNPESLGLNGLSFYFPLANSDTKQAFVQRYKQFADSGYLVNYYQFLLSYVQNVRGVFGKSLPPLEKRALGGSGAENQHNEPSVTVQSNVSVSNSIELVEKGLLFEVPLDPELLNSFVQSYYLILRKDGQDVYRLVEQGHGLVLSEKGVLSVTLMDHVRMISGEDGQMQILPFIESERGESYLKGGTRLLRRRIRDVQMMTGRVIHNQETPSGHMMSLSPFTDSPMMMRVDETLEKEDCLTPVYQVRRLTLDNNGEPLPFYFWKEEDTGVVYGKEFVVGKDGPHIAFLPCGSDAEYYVQICVEDVYGVTYATSLTPLNKKED